MAKCYGISSSFREVAAAAQAIDASARITDLESLHRLIQARRSSLPLRSSQLMEVVQAEVAALLRHSAEVVQAAEQLGLNVSADMKLAEARADDLRLRQGWFVWRWVNALRAALVMKRVRRQASETLGRAHDMQQFAAQVRGRADEVTRDPSGEVQRRLVPEVNAITKLEALASSSTARGAVGELEVETELRRLSDQFWVMHDVRLAADSFLRFDQKPVQSAQIDHLVVGPTGVFVLETKSWSAATIAKGNHFDPFEQVGRAGLLTHVLLKNAALYDRVNNVIVSHQPIAPTRSRRFTKSLRPGQVLWFIRNRPAALSEREVESVATYLLKRGSSGRGGEVTRRGTPSDL